MERVTLCLYHYLVVTLLVVVPSRVVGDIIFPEMEPCTLRTGEVGRCVPLRDCPPVFATFKQQPPVTCRFEGFTHIVCCPKEGGTIPHIDLDISPPSAYQIMNCGRSAVKVIETFGGLARKKRADLPLPIPDYPEFPARPEVAGGIISERNAWPWVALLGQRDAAGINWFCGGVMINRQWVLSAHHCFNDFYADVVRLGEHDYNDDNDGASHRDYDVAQTVFYPDYTFSEAYHDLTLLKLASPVKLHKFISPVCLPWGKQSEENIVNQITTIVGWGNTLYGGLPSSVLMEADVQVFPVSRCDSSYSTLSYYKTDWPHGIGEETLCAGDPDGGKDACQGDSGGPLVIRNSTGRYVLAGIVSRGYGCGHKDYPGLYVNIRHAPYLAWIKKVAFSKQ